MKEAHQFFEAGVFYYRNRWTNLEFIPRGYLPVTYNWNHVATEKSGVSEIWINSRNPMEDLKRLCDHWSNRYWEYWRVL